MKIQKLVSGCKSMSASEHREQVARNIFNYVHEEVDFLDQYGMLEMNHLYLEEVAEEAALWKWASEKVNGTPTRESLDRELHTNGNYLRTKRGRSELEEIENKIISDWEPTPEHMAEIYANWIKQPEAYKQEHGVNQGYEKDERFKRADNIIDRMRDEGETSMPTFKKALADEFTGPEDFYSWATNVPEMHEDYLVGNYMQEKLGIETVSTPDDDEMRPEEELAIGIRRVYQDPINWVGMALGQPVQIIPPSNESDLMEFFFDIEDEKKHLEQHT